MSRIHFAFTALRLDATKRPVSGRINFYDAETPGLCLVMTAAGSRSFYFIRRSPHSARRVKIKLGPWPGLGITEARAQAVALLAKVHRGEDPMAEKREARKAVTLGEAFDQFMAGHAKPKLRRPDEYQERFDLHLAGWRGRLLASLTRSEVQDWHGRIGAESGPYAANRAHSVLRRVYNWSRDRGLADANPAEGVERFHEASRDRFLSPDEVSRLLGELGAMTDPAMADFVSLLLFVGQRRSAVAGMRWADLDLTGAVWRLPSQASKNKRSLMVPLTPQALEILQRRRSTVPVGTPWIFPSTRTKSGHITGPRDSWTQLLARAGLENVRPHDLRRTMASWMVAAGASMPTIGRALGHSSLGSTAVYARAAISDVRLHMDAVSKAMQSARSTPTGGPLNAIAG